MRAPSINQSHERLHAMTSPTPVELPAEPTSYILINVTSNADGGAEVDATIEGIHPEAAANILRSLADTIEANELTIVETDGEAVVVEDGGTVASKE